MTTRYKKKLIEVAMPLEVINAESKREKCIRHGHPSTLHLWWARRPLAACRAVLFAQLVDDPSEHVDELLENPVWREAAEKELAERLAKLERETEEDNGNVTPASEIPITIESVIVDLERQRLFGIIKKLVKWKNGTNKEVLDCARAEIRRSCGDDLPSVYDPFSGGGSIPLEAQRLGLPAYGSDLNPVAVMIGKAMIEIPTIFMDMDPVHQGIKGRSFYRNAEGMAEDVKYYGEWVRQRAFDRIGHLYPKVALPKGYQSDEATVVAWIWARTVPSPDPAFTDVQVPIASSFLLSSKKGKMKVWVAPSVNKASKTIEYAIRTGGTKEEIAKAKIGTKMGQGANFRCIMSGTAITPDHIKNSGMSGKMGQQLIAVVAEGKCGRIYVAPSEDHAKMAMSAEPFFRPEMPVPGDISACWTAAYGLTTLGDLFTNRQLVTLKTFSDLVHDAREQIKVDALAIGMHADDIPLRSGGKGAKSYAEAVSVYLALAVDRIADRGSTVCSWDSGYNKIRNTFSKQVISVAWDFAEGNAFSNSTGSWKQCIKYISNVVAHYVPSALGKEVQHDAQTVAYPENTVISTDPPYYDNIGYADLSDYFFCWMKLSLKPVYPDLFSLLAVPKSEELVATPNRHGGKEGAKAFFLDGMRKVIANMASRALSDFPTTIYYAFKQSEIKREGVSSTGWATFLQAVIDAGYTVVRTWPLRTEMASRMIASGTNALSSSVVLVCRKRDPSEDTVTRSEFIRELKRELPQAIAELQAVNIPPADMPQSAIGPGMGIFSGYKHVLEADDSPMEVRTALQLINAELDTFLNKLTGDFDEETRFAVTWFEQFGYEKDEYGTADNLARARGISVDSVKHAGIVEGAGGKVRILNRNDLLNDWNPIKDDYLTVWKCCQYVISALETDSEYGAALLLKKIGSEKSDAVKDLAYCLYDICSNKRKDAEEATSYNALIAVWAELTRQAASIDETDLDGDRQAEMKL